MLFADTLLVLRGGGDLATGIAYRLHQAGFPLLVLELERPLVVRRYVALATAVLEGEIHIEGLHGQRVETVAEALPLARSGIIPVLVSPHLPDWSKAAKELTQRYRLVLTCAERSRSSVAEVGAEKGGGATPTAIIDARMAKRNIDTKIDQAPLVVALGPGFTAGVDCHAVIETMRGHRLGRVIWQGAAQPNTGTPGLVAGKGAERVLRAPAAGVVQWQAAIGDSVAAGAVLGHVDEQPVVAPFAGVLRGLIASGTAVPTTLKIGDLDARNERDACFTISDKALAIGGGVLEAVLTHLNIDYVLRSA
jgi:xanthine dehydrogenase accessory factor